MFVISLINFPCLLLVWLVSLVCYLFDQFPLSVIGLISFPCLLLVWSVSLVCYWFDKTSYKNIMIFAVIINKKCSHPLSSHLSSLKGSVRLFQNIHNTTFCGNRSPTKCFLNTNLGFWGPETFKIIFSDIKIKIRELFLFWNRKTIP